MNSCAVCGSLKIKQQSWYLIVKNPWEDRVKILRWESALAGSPGILSACGASHVRDLLIQWLTSETLPSGQESLPPVFAPEQSDFFEVPAWQLASHLHPIGELAIHRRSLHESPATLHSVLDAVFCTLQNESPNPEIFADQSVLSCPPRTSELMPFAQSASA